MVPRSAFGLALLLATALAGDKECTPEDISAFWKKLGKPEADVPATKEITVSAMSEDDADVLTEILYAELVPNLERLIVRGNRLGDEATVEIVTAAAHLHKLRELDVSDNDLTDEGVAMVGADLGSEVPAELRALRLTGNQFGVVGMQSLAVGLASGVHNLEELNLDRTGMASDGARVLAKAFAKGSLAKLRSLHLQNNRIGDDGLTALTTGFGSGGIPNLEDLWLADNGIGDAGMTAFAQAAAAGKLPKLANLNLANHKMGPKGVKALARAIEKGGMASLHHVRMRVGDTPGNADTEANKALIAACTTRGIQLT